MEVSESFGYDSSSRAFIRLLNTVQSAVKKAKQQLIENPCCSLLQSPTFDCGSTKCKPLMLPGEQKHSWVQETELETLKNKAVFSQVL